jgi:hypothetical protein
MGTWFSAKRDGKCSHCKQPFKSGDEIYAKSAGVYLGSGCGCGHVAESEPVIAGPRETAVMHELAKLPEEAQTGLIAMNTLGLARDLDEGDVAPRERPNFTKEMRINLLTLQDMFPPSEAEDETEEARRKRERRARESDGF